MLISEIESDLLDFADFEEVGSVSRARSFITAAKRWLILRADSASHQSSSMTIGKTYVQDMLKRAQDFVSANSRAGGVRHLGVGRGFR
jgi:hypothetical protein